VSGFLSELRIAKHYYDHQRLGPVMIDLHPTLACQNRCYFCISENFHVGGIDRPNFSREHTLEWSVLKNVIQEWREMGVKSIQLTGGGEPSLYYKFPELLEEIKDFRVGMITNGILVGKYVNDIYKSVDWIRISLDASNADMYKLIKKTNNFDKVIDSLKMLTSVNGIDHLRIGVAYIITPESIEGITEAAKLIEDIGGVDYLQFKDVISRGTTFDEEYRKMIETEVTLAKSSVSLPVFYTSHKTPRSHNHPNCLATNYVSVLGADGNVYSCCHLEYLPKYSCGSIYNKSYKDIWLDKTEMKINEKMCWNCRFMKTNDILHELDNIQDEDFI
jgi:wyosine [tRNA(Phe)-imidazoG37] synthetase (radical SAM superfamily)